MVEVDWPGVDERLTKHGCFAFHVFGAIVGKVFLEQLPRFCSSLLCETFLCLRC